MYKQQNIYWKSI